MVAGAAPMDDRRPPPTIHRMTSLELARLQFISDMRAAGLSLEEIRDLLELKGRAESGEQAAARAVGELASQIASLDERIALLTRLRAELGRTHEILSGCKRCENHQNFPDQCDACSHVASQAELPKTMQVLWSVGREPV